MRNCSSSVCYRPQIHLQVENDLHREEIMTRRYQHHFCTCHKAEENSVTGQSNTWRTPISWSTACVLLERGLYRAPFVIVLVCIAKRMTSSLITHVTVETSIGSFTIELYYQHAPKACHNFSQLAHNGYYNSTIFHRIIKDFMIQGGDPTGTGRGGESIYGGHFEDEIDSTLKHTGAGIVSMANAGKNTNGSQFFVTLAPTPWLDGKHTIFGRVSDGIQVIQRVGLVPTGPNDCPREAIRIVKAFPVTA
uniref:Peptidyl-prolyl cis-trans isomerase n=1 Tax=Albugo laibachii Nc14 TaxID=890382 RepID=F0WUN6_9STRA|nr:peptidylprolyl cistrans isomerase ppi1 putative [Albugo laibachii Nc14]|eukprot:CCA25117.1 peptidylprolyl cistrans isomerase ppi1 putative [Albugo laibachii Nc14]